MRWRDGKAVFKAAAAPPADIVALIDARKAEVSAFLHPDAVRGRLDAEAEVLQAPQPPDVRDGEWEAALRGLRSFIELGYAEEALRLGWARDQLFAIPKLWARVDLCGAGLLIGDREVSDVTPGAIRVKTSSGATLAFHRKPEIDYALIFETRLKLIRGDYPGDSEEPRLRAREYAINFYRSNNGCDLETAKRMVPDLLKPAGRP